MPTADWKEVKDAGRGWLLSLTSLRHGCLGHNSSIPALHQLLHLFPCISWSSLVRHSRLFCLAAPWSLSSLRSTSGSGTPCWQWSAPCLCPCFPHAKPLGHKEGGHSQWRGRFTALLLSASVSAFWVTKCFHIVCYSHMYPWKVCEFPTECQLGMCQGDSEEHNGKATQVFGHTMTGLRAGSRTCENSWLWRARGTLWGRGEETIFEQGLAHRRSCTNLSYQRCEMSQRISKGSTDRGCVYAF